MLLCKLAQMATLRGHDPMSIWLSEWSIGWVLVPITPLPGHPFAVLNLSNCKALGALLQNLPLQSLTKDSETH